MEPNSSPRAATWCRVSTGEQETENQRRDLQAEADRRGVRVVHAWDFDASAWRGDHRPELADLYRAAERHEFTILLVWALDRLSREGAMETLQIVHRLAKAGVTVVSLREPWVEASGELRDLLIALTGWVAQFESRRRSERTKAGIERARAEGKHLGRPAGSKDKAKRRRAGYYARWEGGGKQATSRAVTGSSVKVDPPEAALATLE